MATVRLTARVTPYSTIVGGGVSLVQTNGQVPFQVAVIGMNGIDREQNDQISKRLAALINEHGMDIDDGT